MSNLEPKIPKRIMIIGRPGGGKSTFAIKIHQIMNYPLLHLDKIFFTENWVEQHYATFIGLQQQWIEKQTWIIDGNSTKSYEMRYQKADVCLYFNFPRYICYWRVFKRLFYKHPAIDDRAPKCKETVRFSLIKYMWGFEKRVFFLLDSLKTRYPNVEFREIRNKEDVTTQVPAPTPLDLFEGSRSYGTDLISLIDC